MKKIRIFLITASIIIFSFTSDAQKTFGWLGSDRSGIYPETGLLKAWPSAGPALLWESSEIGTGYSSVTSTDDAIYITGRRGENDLLTAFTQDGKKKWEVIYAKSSDSNFPDTREQLLYQATRSSL
ncbi:MAG: hypothetical protein IPN67_18510 [Bacteroidales bacterium]|nr:hypothetical protein [Bacteroidales bacterium]